MKYGVCASLFDDLLLSLPQAGADYVEIGLSALEAVEPERVLERRAVLEGVGLSCEAGNVLFPGTAPLYGGDLTEYLDNVLGKASLLGISIAVFGSGAARKIPAGMSRELAFEQMVKFCREQLAPAAQRHGILCCLEPLCTGETNIFNTLSQGYELVKAVDHPHFQLLCDLYHFDLEKEPLSHIEDCGPALAHLHIASAANSRRIPQEDDGQSYDGFFNALRKIGYNGRISLEGDFSSAGEASPPATIARSLAYLRSLSSPLLEI